MFQLFVLHTQNPSYGRLCVQWYIQEPFALKLLSKNGGVLKQNCHIWPSRMLKHAAESAAHS